MSLIAVLMEDEIYKTSIVNIVFHRRTNNGEAESSFYRFGVILYKGICSRKVYVCLPFHKRFDFLIRHDHMCLGLRIHFHKFVCLHSILFSTHVNNVNANDVNAFRILGLEQT